VRGSYRDGFGAGELQQAVVGEGLDRREVAVRDVVGPREAPDALSVRFSDRYTMLRSHGDMFDVDACTMLQWNMSIEPAGPSGAMSPPWSAIARTVA